MKKILLILMACGLFQLVKAQGYIPDKLHSIDAFVEAYDANGHLIGSNLSPEGSPFLYDRWQSGEVYFENGRHLTNVPLQFDLTRQELRFQNKNQSYLFAEPVSAFRIVNPDSTTSLFRTGYPPANNNDNSRFYQVLADGKYLQLLLFRHKSPTQVNEYNGPTKIQYKEWDQLYVYNVAKKQFIEVNLHKSYIKKHLPELAPLLDKYDSRQVTLKQLAEAVEEYDSKSL